MKIVVIIIVLVLFIFDTYIKYLMYKTPSKVDERTSEVYDSEKYAKWLVYNKEKIKLDLIGSISFLLITLVLLIFNIHYLVFNYLSSVIASKFLVNVLFLLVINVVTLPLSIFFSHYETFKIEEKYGFNKQTKKTFVKDTIIKTIFSNILIIALVIMLNSLFINLKELFIVIGVGAVFLLLFVSFLLAPFFSRIFNKFVPLEEGVLKDGIMTLMDKANFKVNKILVMDASKRTTKMNAYFTGFGKNKRIVLYDNIINNMSEEEIIAVLAHELGHAKKKDITKLLLMNVVTISILISLIYLGSTYGKLPQAFGFKEDNFIFSIIIVFEIIGIVLKLVEIPKNLYIRHIEYKADYFSAEIYSKEALISALKKLSGLNFSNLNPHPFVVLMLYDHPTLFQRIDALNVIE